MKIVASGHARKRCGHYNRYTRGCIPWLSVTLTLTWAMSCTANISLQTLQQADIVAYVADDPDQLYKVAVVSGTAVIAGVGRTVVGNNMSLVQNAGSTQSGNSRVAVLSSSAATTNTLPIRVIDVVSRDSISRRHLCRADC